MRRSKTRLKDQCRYMVRRPCEVFLGDALQAAKHLGISVEEGGGIPSTVQAAFRGDWLRTGDVYTRSADGQYTFLGRNSDMIKAGGIWVSPTEVEARIVQHESVAECAVVGLRDADGLEEVVACVVAMPGQAVDGDELIAFCREGLAAFKRPRQVLVVEGLPKTATGKIQRVVVREIAAEALRA